MNLNVKKKVPWIKRDYVFLAGLALLKILIHLPVLHRYGYHHDELYFIACGKHTAFGYVDHPPFVPWIAGLTTTLFGDSLFALRILATLSSAMAVFMVGAVVKRLGGGRFAQLLAGEAYVNRMTREEMASIEVLEHMKFLMGKNRVLDGRTLLDRGISRR